MLCNTVLKPLGVFGSRECESSCAMSSDSGTALLDLVAEGAAAREGAEKSQSDNALGLERAKVEALPLLMLPAS